MSVIYEVINPSDPVTIEADDVEVAQAVCLLLGEGKYALNDSEENEVMPLLLFGGFEKWAEEQRFDLSAVLGQKRADVVRCLRSAMCCSVRDRLAVQAAVGDDHAAMARYNDAKRSSLNDICGYAFAWAAKYELKAREEKAG